jgi:beta-lactamase superfamily II metal-dependent hydrolase
MAEIVEPFPVALDRKLLHVFVFGADVGEAIAVALPERGWVLIDGCKLQVGEEERFPALDAYAALRADDSDSIELLLWTHPHADHYLGIREAIEQHRPQRVGMTMVEQPPPGSANAELLALGSHPMLPADLHLSDVFKLVRSTLERVFLYWQEDAGSRFLVSAQSNALTIGATTIRAHSPDQAALQKLYKLPTDKLRNALRTRANQYSIVLGVEYGNTSLVLGGDLPFSLNRVALPHAWPWVLHNSPGLVGHDGFKISHHGSAEAIPPEFVARANPARAWFVAPFAREQLPRPGDDHTGGLRQLLQRVDAVRLTSSVGLVSPTQSGQRIERAELKKRLAAVEAGRFAGGMRAPVATTAFDFSWGAAFDANRNVQKLFAGAQAISVIESAT